MRVNCYAIMYSSHARAENAACKTKQASSQRRKLHQVCDADKDQKIPQMDKTVLPGGITTSR